MDIVFGNTQTEELVVNESNCKASNEKSMNEELVCGIKKEAFNKVSMGTFCKVADIKEEDGKRVYNLEDAYGNIKGFDEAQVLGQLQLGTLNVINLEIDNNNKLVKKTPEALEVTYDNINYIREFPCLVKIFDQTTEKEGTAVAVGYKHEDKDKYETVINVVINGNMYEATYQNIKSQNPTCHENTCLTCNKRSSNQCRYNRYGGGWKLCINIGGQYKRVTYKVDCMYPDRELLAVAKDNGVVKAYLVRGNINGDIRNIWQEVGEREPFEDMKFCNTLKWGGVLYYDVPIIDWNTFNEKRITRLEYLEEELETLCWRAAVEGSLDIYDSETVYPSFKDKTTYEYFNDIWCEYWELDGKAWAGIYDIRDFLSSMCAQENKELWMMEIENYRMVYVADEKDGFEGRRYIAQCYKEEVEELVNVAEWNEDDAKNIIYTNIWDNKVAS